MKPAVRWLLGAVVAAGLVWLAVAAPWRASAPHETARQASRAEPGPPSPGEAAVPRERERTPAPAASPGVAARGEAPRRQNVQAPRRRNVQAEPGTVVPDSLRTAAVPTEEIPDSDDGFEFESTRAEGETLSHWEVRSLVERGDEQSFRTLRDVLFDPNTDPDTRQDILANVEEMIEADDDLIHFLKGVIEDDSQPDDIRVQALSRLSDFGFEQVLPYQEHANEELASEVDLLERLELYRLQQERAEEG